MWRSQDPRNYLYIPTENMIKISYYNDLSTIIYIHIKLLHLTHDDNVYLISIYIIYICAPDQVDSPHPRAMLPFAISDTARTAPTTWALLEAE
jgi:hypothetical protein